MRDRIVITLDEALLGAILIVLLWAKWKGWG